jgi:hypothetical protein
MEDLYPYISNLAMPALVGVVSLGVSFIRDMAKNIQAMTISVQELNLKISNVNEAVDDHEARLRVVERMKIARKRS